MMLGMARPALRDWLQILLAFLIAAPLILLWFGVPWLAWLLQFFPAR